MKKFIIILFLAILSAGTTMAKGLSAHRGEVENGYNFWLYDPNDVEIDDPKPVVIFLHGSSLCGNDLNRVKRYGTIDAIERGREIDAYVIAPQNPGGAWSPLKVMNVLDWVSDNYNIDYDRVYVIGMSLGGYGTIDVTATYPDRIAAAIAMCGGGSVKDLSGLNDVPLWIIHGTADSAVTIAQSDKVVEAMKASAGSNGTKRLIYNRVPGMNHSRPARMFYLNESYEWLFKHTLKDAKRVVHPSFSVEDAMGGAYSDLKSSGKSSGKSSIKAKSSKKKSSRKTAQTKTKKKTGKRRG